MTPEEAYRAAEVRIEQARKSGTTELEFSDLPLESIPPELFELRQLEKLRFAPIGSSETECQLRELPEGSQEGSRWCSESAN